jgi:uncharacterized cofD-like protein
MMAMSDKPQTVKDLFMYRFDEQSSLNGHSIKNLIMTALLEMQGDFTHSIPILAELLDIKGNIFPVTEDNVDLVGITDDGTRIMGESQITEARSRIRELQYDKDVTANPRVLKALREADLIIFSSGSLVTSIMPHIIIPEIQEAVRASKARKMYVCNILTQPGETDDFTVSKHVEMLEKYLGEGAIDAVIANDRELPKDLKLFANSEGKDPVAIDGALIAEKHIELISDKIYSTEDGSIRHDALKTAYLMFSYIMDLNKG